MDWRKLKPIAVSVAVILGLVLLDRLLKWWAVSLQDTIDLGFVSLHLIFNTGASFGILQGQNLLLSVIALAVLAAIVFFWKTIPAIPRNLVIAGIIGNLIDRVFIGSVIDFVDLGWWPVFNLADSLLVIGVGWLVVLEFLQMIKQRSH